MLSAWKADQTSPGVLKAIEGLESVFSHTLLCENITMDACIHTDFSAAGLPADNSGQKLIWMEQGGHLHWPM